MAELLGGLIAHERKLHREKFAKLERRIDELERRSLKYAGTWSENEKYLPNLLVTHAGALWCSVKATAKGEMPGKSGGWKLVSKSHK